MVDYSRFQELNPQWSDNEMQKNYAIALQVEKKYIDKYGSTIEPKIGDIVEFTDGYQVYKHAKIVENVYFEDANKRVCICERGGSFVSSHLHFSTSGGAFKGADKSSLVYVGEDENIVWTWGCNGAGANQGIYFPLKVNRWIIPYDPKSIKRSTVYFRKGRDGKGEGEVQIENSGSCMIYEHTFCSREAFEAWARYTGYEYQMDESGDRAYSPQEVKQRCWIEDVAKPKNGKPIKVLANGSIHDGLVVKDEFCITEWWGNTSHSMTDYNSPEYHEKRKEYFKYHNNPMGV
jgi:hypothetical protein